MTDSNPGAIPGHGTDTPVSILILGRIMSIVVESELFGDARATQRVFQNIRKAQAFMEDTYRDGGTARIVTIGKN